MDTSTLVHPLIMLFTDRVLYPISRGVEVDRAYRYNIVQQIQFDKIHVLIARQLPHHNSLASLSTNRPQIGYLFLKCSAQHLMLALLRGKPNHTSVSIRKKQKTGTNISRGVRSSRLSSGWSIDVSGPIQSQVEPTINGARSKSKRGVPGSNDCLATLLDASRPATRQYIPSWKPVSHQSVASARQRVLCSPGP